MDLGAGIGDAVLGSVLSAPLLGAFSRPVGPKPPAASARDQLLNATGVRANVGIGLPEGGVNNGAIVPRAYDPNQVINPAGLGAGTATGEVVDTTFRNAPEGLPPGRTPAITEGDNGPIQQPAANDSLGLPEAVPLTERFNNWKDINGVTQEMKDAAESFLRWVDSGKPNTTVIREIGPDGCATLKIIGTGGRDITGGVRRLRQWL